MADLKHPQTAVAAREAFDATGAKTHPEFVALTLGAISLRTFRYWLAGERPADTMAQQYLGLIKDGWRPGQRAKA